MGKKIFVIILLVFLNTILLAQGNWRFDEGRKSLLYKEQPFVPYQGVWTPLGYYVFTAFATNPFHFYGWQKVDSASAIPSASRVLGEEELRRGWAFFRGQPSNVKLGEWIYFPATALWARPDSFIKLYRQWQLFYEHYPQLTTSVYNLVSKDTFYRFVTPYLNKEIKKVEAELPSGWIEVYKRRLESDGLRQLFLFYFPGIDEKQKKIEWIRIKYLYEDGRKKESLLKIIYQKDTGLGLRAQ